MIPKETVDRVRRSTVAVLRLDLKHEDLLAGVSPGDRIPIPGAEVVATGFLVERDVILTNRHVVAAIAEEHARDGHHDHWYVSIAYPAADGVAQTYRRVQSMFAFVDPADEGRIDAGFLSIAEEIEGPCQPVEFGDLASIVIGSNVAVCGYPLGSKLLTVGLGGHRFGPVVHEGIISGVSPFDVIDPRQISAFLTDLNTAGGMSGSPVFRPDNGKIIGLHYAGLEGTLGCSVPVDAQRVQGWVSFFRQVLAGTAKRGQVQVSLGGDIRL